MNMANKITILRILLIPLIIVLLQPYPPWIVIEIPFFGHLNEWGIYYGAFLFLLTAATDKLDGYIARKYKIETNLGKLLDPLADKLLVLVTLIMLVNLHMIQSWVVTIIISREIIVTALRLVATTKGVVLAADNYGKLKMVFQVIAITSLLLNNYPFALVTDLRIDHMLMFIAILLTLYSGFNYIKTNYRKLQLNV
ncbi:CDP-diacylglycerol--glycerol-3-phosphate 3-phosphatidyltransferase [Paenibacillus yanchengensis]|uniref:CDP-diacylglycerol--glycerol-3-phosphate 3-phosphatidyltransferase n=1 Tax=Paenibacillus yanchengensis TaxID=2035833 RepID=A0ABW4YQP9_9BACL